MVESNAKTPTTKDTPAAAEDQITNAEAQEVVEQKTEVSAATPAKAGRRSTKALEAAEAKAAKEERKAQTAEDEAAEAEKPKQKANPTRPKVERQGKKFRESAKLVEADKLYSLDEALALAAKTNPAKFDATVEVHVNLNVDPRHADQNIRDNLVLPAGTGKTVRVAVLADVDDAAAATKVGADIAGVDEILGQLEKGQINFDTLVATPAMMPRLGKYARVLGPRGLMPNPKSGTVTTDVTKAVNEAKAGRVEYRVDSTGIVHVGIGKVSFDAPKLLQNANALLASIRSNKPQSVKSNYIKAIYIATAMGPSIKVDLSTIG